MSIKVQSIIWDRSPYTNTMLLIHLAMGDFANDDGEFWAKQSTLAKKARVSVRYVEMAVAQMKQDGLLTVTKKGRRNVYTLHPIPEESSGVESEYPKSATRKPEPQFGSIEPSVEPSRTEPSFRARSARGKDSMKTIGNLDDPEPPPTRYPLTHRGTVEYFSNEARRLRAHGGIPRLQKTISVLHKEDGLSYDQIQGMVRYFFLHYEEEIRWMNKEYTATALFQSKLQRIKNADPKPITYEEPDEEDKWAELLG